MERALRQSLMMSEGSLSILVSRPISAVMLSVRRAGPADSGVRQTQQVRLKALEQE